MAKGKWKFLHRSEQYIYYYRRAIPEFLRTTFNNKWEIKKSLRTRDKSCAILKHNELNIKVERLFMKAKQGKVVSKDLSSMLETLEDRKRFVAEINNHPKETIFSGICMTLRGKPILADNGTIIAPVTISMRKDGKLIDPDGNIISDMTVSFALSIADRQGIIKISSEVESLVTSKMKVSGGFFWDGEKGQGNTYNSESKNLEKISACKSKQTKPEQNYGLIPILFSEMVDKYIGSRHFKQKQTETAQRNEFNYFLALCGDVFSTEITRQMVMGFREKLEKFPKNARKKYPEKSLQEIAKMDIPVHEYMSSQNVNKYLARLSTLFDWAVDYSYMTENLTPQRKLKESDDKKTEPFTLEELQKYFLESPIHRDRITKGNKIEMFWIPLIALFSGARIEEICALQINDVKIVEDNRTGEKIWCFDFNKGDGAKHVKNDPSIRYVAIHSELRKLGFMKYFQDRQSQGFETLWDLKPMSGRTTDKYSQAFGRRHRTYLRNKINITSKKTTFHSFRHTVIKALRENPDVREDYMKALVGHGQTGTTGKEYYSKLGIACVRDTVEGIKYPRLDLSHLYINMGSHQ